MWGLAKIDLHFQRAGDSKGTLSLVAAAADVDEVLGSWSVAYRSIPDGWLTFCFPVSVTSTGNFLRLSLRWEPTDDSAPHLCLSDEYIEPLGACAVDAPGRTLRLPALRLWTASQGFTQPAPHWNSRTDELPDSPPPGGAPIRFRERGGV
jgi:hypothetical protein